MKYCQATMRLGAFLPVTIGSILCADIAEDAQRSQPHGGAHSPLEIRFQSPPGSSNSAGDAWKRDSPGALLRADWQSQAQPIGNGRLGAMIFGSPDLERIQFNESSLWTGGSNESGGYTIEDFGAYQNFGDLILVMDAPDGATEPRRLSGYSRVLDLSNAVHTTTWQDSGVTYKREAFASHPDDVIVIRITADQPGKLRGGIRLVGGHGEASVANGSRIGFSGSLPNGLRYAAAIHVWVDGGDVVASDDGTLAWHGDEAWILLAAATDYRMHAADDFRSGVDPVETVNRQLVAAKKSYDVLHAAHVASHRELMGRVDLDLGAPPDGRPIEQRLPAYKKGGNDPHLEALMFHYGRYLMISSSRGFLPANLQGLWNHSNAPSWHSDYHTNINLQMNYWGSEVANLGECSKPLLDWTIAMIPGSREATLRAFGEATRGWTMRTSVNIFGGNGWEWNLPASAWLALHFHEHHAFTGDKQFLANTAWPLFREVSEFWLDHLKEKDGKLVVPNAWSPEHGPREDGVAHDQQIVWDLFTNTLEAAGALGIHDEFTEQVRSSRDRLLGPQIGSWGQLMEWTTERPELEKSGHRHTSHLFAVYPGRQISLEKTPELAKAAAVSLDARGTSGDSRRSWTWPWRTAMWARLGHPEKAGEMVRGLLVHNTLPNLYATHPPFQIDGNLGMTGGIAEMLLQSHAGMVSVMPAVPSKWPHGSYRGLRARGGFEVSATWKDGEPTLVKIHSLHGNPLVLKFPSDPAKIHCIEDGASKSEIHNENGVFRLNTQAGKNYEIRF